MVRILLILDSIFSVWMLIDALQRGARSYWYMVVMLPFGEWFYFFKVKIHDPEFAFLRNAWQGVSSKPVSVEQLKLRLDQSPSFENRLAFAQALYDNEHYEKALQHFADAIESWPDSEECLYGLGLCQNRLGQHENAIVSFRRLIENSERFQDYAPWQDLAETLSSAKREPEALVLLERLVDISPRLYHRVLYAHYLMGASRLGDAREHLQCGLDDNETAPRYIRKKDRSVARAAKNMLKEIDRQEKAGAPS